MLGSAYLWLLTDKWRSVQRLARACLAADPGKPGATRSTRGRASTARIAGLALKEARLRGLGQLRARRPPPPLPRARPARPGRPPRRSSSPFGSCSATRTGRQWLGRLRGRPRARPIAARRSLPQPPGSVLLRCPHLLQLSSARSGSRGREEGAETGREREGSPGRGSRSLLLYGAERPEDCREGTRSCAPVACALACHRGGRSPGARGAGVGRGRARPRAWGGGRAREGAPPARAGSRAGRGEGGGAGSSRCLLPVRGAPLPHPRVSELQAALRGPWNLLSLPRSHLRQARGPS